MENKLEETKKAIEEYQCSGCSIGSDMKCFSQNEQSGVGCGSHSAGTFVSQVGKILLGMPKGFNRLGLYESLKPIINNTFEGSDGEYDKFNIPVWKHLNDDGHTLVRGIMPRKNEPFIHIYLENCMDKINCLEITKEDIKGMD